MAGKTDEKVTEKSTKTEIWQAYRQALARLEGQPAGISDDASKLYALTTSIQKTKSSLGDSFDAAAEQLAGLQQAYAAAGQELARHKSEAREAVEQARGQLEAEIQVVRKQWQQEQTDRELARKREEDAYEYDLSRKRRDENEAYERSAKQREAALADREATVAEREQKLDELQQQVAGFPAERDQAVKAAGDELARELKTAADNTIKDTKLTAEHEKSILGLKLQNAEAAIASQGKQITELQRQLDVSAAQLREMAVAVIQAKNTTPASTQE